MNIRDGEISENPIIEPAINEQAQDEQNIEPTTEYWYGKYAKPDIMDRFKVHLIDTAVVYIILSVIYYLVMPGAKFEISNFLFLYFFAVYTNAAEFLTWIMLFLTNGFTVGKFLYKHRVIRMDGQKLTLRDVFVRNFLIKGFCDAASCGIMNIVSILVAYGKPSNRAVHDIAANTLTIQLEHRKEKPEREYKFD